MRIWAWATSGGKMLVFLGQDSGEEGQIAEGVSHSAAGGGAQFK